MRLVDDPPARGSWNMAVDDALLEALAGGFGVATLRFYDWEPAALSLGYAQPDAGIDRLACERAGIDVVRRPTGGRAVLHAGELTYAVCRPAGRQSIAQSYCEISGAIARAISRVGVPARLAMGTSRRRSPDRSGAPGSAGVGPAPGVPADCFGVSTRADLVAGGRKLVGSAQVRRRGCLLQHGSIKLAPARVPMSVLLRVPEPDVRPACIGDWLHDPPEDLPERLKRLIAVELGVAWEPAALTERELVLASTAARRSFARRLPGPRTGRLLARG